MEQECEAPRRATLMEDAHHRKGDRFRSLSICLSPLDPTVHLMASLSDWTRVDQHRRVNTNAHTHKEAYRAHLHRR